MPQTITFTVPTTEEAQDWITDASDRVGEVFNQVKTQVVRRRQKRTVGNFLKSNLWLLLLLGAVLAVGIVVVSGTPLSDMFSSEIELDEDEDI